MKIAIDARWINHGFRQGLLTSSERLIYSLSEVDTDNEYLLMFTSLRRGPQEMPGPNQNNFRKVVLPIPDKSFFGSDILFNQFFLPMSLNKNQCDIYHALAGYSLPVSNHTKKILTIHDLRSLKIPDKTFPQNIASLKKAANSADVCITVSECTKQDIIENLNIIPEKIKVTYNGVDEIFKPTAKDFNYLQKKYGIKRKFLFSLGTVPRKNIERLLKAFNIFKYRDDLLLVIGGAGNNEAWVDNYYKLIGKLGLEKNVKVLGYIPYEDLPLFYNCSECFVFPSLYEGFGIPILEAMKCKTPVIASNVSSLPEIGADAALYADPYNEEDIAMKMQNIIEDEALRNSLIEKGLKRASQFSWKKMASETLDIYKGLMR